MHPRITNNVVEEENVTLRCVGVGYPPPLVQWRKLNRSLSDRVSITNMSMSTDDGNVTRVIVDQFLTSVSREDTGDYECLASNIFYNATRIISLIVQCTYIVYNFYLLCIQFILLRNDAFSS